MRKPSIPAAVAQPAPITDLASADAEYKSLDAEIRGVKVPDGVGKPGYGGAAASLSGYLNHIGMGQKVARRDQLKAFIDKTMAAEDKARREGGKGMAANVLSDQSYRRGTPPGPGATLNSGAAAVLL